VTFDHFEGSGRKPILFGQLLPEVISSRGMFCDTEWFDCHSRQPLDEFELELNARRDWLQCKAFDDTRRTLHDIVSSLNTTNTTTRR